MNCDSQRAPDYRRYLRVFGGITLLGLLGLGAFNVLMDPSGAYPAVSLKGLARQRETVVSRAAKAELLRHADPEVLLLGTSRVRTGLPVSNPAYGSDRVYNLGLDGTAIIEAQAVLDFALQHARPRRVLLETDFLMFSDTRTEGVGFEDSRFNPQLDLIEYHFKNVFGAQNTDESWSLFRQWVGWKASEPGERGFVPKEVRRNASQRELFAHQIRSHLTGPMRYRGFRSNKIGLEAYREMVRQCGSNRVELISFVPPVHAVQLETLRAAGLWDAYEGWKREIVRIIAEEAPEGGATFWDFTGFTGPVAEPVPPVGDTATRMRGYRESSHFTAALGAMAIERMLGKAAESHDGPRFGARLTPDNIEAHLARLRAERVAYAESQPEIAWVNRVVESLRGTNGVGSASGGF